MKKNNTSRWKVHYFLPSTHGRETEARWGKIESVGKSMCLLFLWTLGMGGGAELRGQTTSVGEETHRFSKLKILRTSASEDSLLYLGYTLADMHSGISTTPKGFLLWTISPNSEYIPDTVSSELKRAHILRNDYERELAEYDHPSKVIEYFSFSRRLKQTSYRSLPIKGGGFFEFSSIEESFKVGEKLYLILDHARYSFLIGPDTIKVPINPRTGDRKFEIYDDARVLLAFNLYPPHKFFIVPPIVEGYNLKRAYIGSSEDNIWLISDSYSSIDHQDSVIKRIMIAHLSESGEWELDTTMDYGWKTEGIKRATTVKGFFPISDEELIIFGDFRDSLFTSKGVYTFQEVLAQQFPRSNIQDSLIESNYVYRNRGASYTLRWDRTQGVLEIKPALQRLGGLGRTLGVNKSIYSHGIGDLDYTFPSKETQASTFSDPAVDYLVKMDSTLTYPWGKKLKHARSSSRFKNMGICPDENGGVWVFGQVLDSLFIDEIFLTSSYPDIIGSYLIHLDSEGNVLSKEIYDSPGYLSIRGMEYIGKNTYLIFGVSCSTPTLEKNKLVFSSVPQTPIRYQKFISTFKMR